MQPQLLDTPIEFLKGVGPKRAELFKKEFEIYTFEDLLHYYPYRHVDKSQTHQIKDIVSEEVYIQLRGKVASYEILGERYKRRLVAQFHDQSGRIELVWFNSIKWIEDLLKRKREFIVFGRPTLFNGRWNITHPELEDPMNQAQSTVSVAFQPLYNSSEKAKKGGLDSRAVSKLMVTLLNNVKGAVPERLSPQLISKYKLLPIGEALENIHYPKSNELLSQAKLRIKFDELFFTQLKMLKIKVENSVKSEGFLFPIVGETFHDYYRNHLPFELTNAQKRVIKEIHTDLKSGKQMNRLLQGDVGSGKTITALMVMLIAKDNGYQSCMMAPTEILATQHYESLKRLLKKTKVTVGFLSGSTKESERKVLLEQLSTGEIDIIVGTHALIEDRVQFSNLGLVVIDEQHRFGVEQRAKLWKKNVIFPHVLVMTATPIPRTLAMTVYGDLDLSVIDELPKGRKPIITKLLFEKDRLALIGFIRQQIQLGRQVFVVYPLIEESEKMDLFDLMAGYDVMSHHFPYPEFGVGIVHGKMKAEEKEAGMQNFVEKRTHILLSTTVIEVGIDIPNASVMVIENAERFGLSQLHQLRGRVGRGAEQSYCILMGGQKISKEGKERLRAMVQTQDGFEIANIDLRLRGPGELEGTRQSGILDFKLADIIKDEKLVAFTRNLAKELLEQDPELKKPEHKPIKKHLDRIIGKNQHWSKIS